MASCSRRDGGDERTPVLLAGAEHWALATHPALALTGEQLLAATRRALEFGARFAPLPPQTAAQTAALAGRASATVLDAETSGGAAAMTVRVRVRLDYQPPLSREDSRVPVEGTATATGSARQAPRQAVEEALRRAVEQLSAVLTASSLSAERLLTELQSTDPVRSAAALESLAARRHPAALPFLLQSLRQGDADAAARALSALVVLDDERAVRAIVEEAERRDPAFLQEALYALGALGGEEAEAYLFTVEIGHLDPRVRAAATEALARARQRGPGPRRPAETRW